jgi:hypothetical protein
MELRTKQPFRHKYNHETIRNDFNGDIYDKIGRGPVPQPMQFLESRRGAPRSRLSKLQVPQIKKIMKRVASASPLTLGSTSPYARSEVGTDDDTGTDTDTDSQALFSHLSPRGLTSPREDEDSDELSDEESDQNARQLRAQHLTNIDAADFEAWSIESKSVDTKATIHVTLQRFFDSFKRSTPIEDHRIVIPKDVTIMLIGK